MLAGGIRLASHSELTRKSGWCPRERDLAIRRPNHPASILSRRGQTALAPGVACKGRRQTKQAAPLSRRRRVATSGPGYQACTFTAGQGIRLAFLRRQILLDAFCLGRLPRLVARGYPVAVRGPCGPCLLSTTDRSSWEDLGVINS